MDLKLPTVDVWLFLLQAYLTISTDATIFLKNSAILCMDSVSSL